MFRPGDHPSATHNPQKPLVLTYIHFDILDQVELVPKSYRVLEDTVDFEYLLSRYVRLFLVKTYAAEEEAQLILKQLLIHLLREDLMERDSIEPRASNQLTERFMRLPTISGKIPDMPTVSKIWPSVPNCPPVISRSSSRS